VLVSATADPVVFAGEGSAEDVISLRLIIYYLVQYLNEKTLRLTGS